jgi:hypothetical protein
LTKQTQCIIMKLLLMRFIHASAGNSYWMSMSILVKEY